MADTMEAPLEEPKAGTDRRAERPAVAIRGAVAGALVSGGIAGMTDCAALATLPERMDRMERRMDAGFSDASASRAAGFSDAKEDRQALEERLTDLIRNHAHQR